MSCIIFYCTALHCSARLPSLCPSLRPSLSSLSLSFYQVLPKLMKITHCVKLNTIFYILESMRPENSVHSPFGVHSHSGRPSLIQVTSFLFILPQSVTFGFTVSKRTPTRSRWTFLPLRGPVPCVPPLLSPGIS